MTPTAEPVNDPEQVMTSGGQIDVAGKEVHACVRIFASYNAS